MNKALVSVIIVGGFLVGLFSATYGSAEVDSICASGLTEINTPADAEQCGLTPLSEVPVPEPSNLYDFVKDKDAAIALGKAFFWDMRVGSDIQACASCHFQAGADIRAKNQLSPGMLIPDTSFGNENGLTASGAVAGPNYTLQPGDFPFHQLSDPTDRNSSVLFDMNDGASSQGTFSGGFISIDRASKQSYDNCSANDATIFSVDGIAVRKVEPRNTPTTIGAIFNHRNFWDGRANNIFNGLNPLGKRGNLPTAADPTPGILLMQPDGSVTTVPIEMDNASLASQATGPPLSDFEMSCASRQFADLGRKLRPRFPLADQEVHPADSVLGSYVKTKGSNKGLNVTYQNLVMTAFKDEYWAKSGNKQLFSANGDPLPKGSKELGYTQMEVNWSLFWGLSIQLYEATLIADQTPFDKWMQGDPDSGFGPEEVAGLEVFAGKGKCINCHTGTEFTGASVRLRANQPDGDEEPIERMIMGDGGTAVYDGGFYNIGVRPTFEDLGVGATLAGFPLAFARQEVAGPKIDDFNFDPDKFEVPGPIVPGERVAVDGAFKVPTLRNVELTGPYFHNGGQASLAQLVEFYDRGGDRRDEGCGDTSGFGSECSNLDPDITQLNLTADEEHALIAFLLSLTDPRVRYEKAPFDHPQLFITNGHPGDQFSVTDDGTGKATDSYINLGAVGAGGGNALAPFLGLSPFQE